MTAIHDKQFLFAVFSETLPDGTSRFSIETHIEGYRSDLAISGLPSGDVHKLLKGERIGRGIHDAQMQALSEKGVIAWTANGWTMTEELARAVAVEMLGKE